MIDVTCAIIIQHHKILVAQNSAASDHAGKWEFPGGKINPEETEEECILREIQEELELDILVFGKLNSVVYDYGNKTIRLIPFVCEIVGGELVLNDHQAVKWVSVDELKALDFAAADKALIEVSDNIMRLKEHLRK